MGDCKRLGVVRISRIELQSLAELGLGVRKIVVLQKPRSCQIGIFGGMNLTFIRGCGYGRNRRLRKRRGAESESNRAGGDSRSAGVEAYSHRLLVRRSGGLTGARDALDAWSLADGRAAHAVANLRGVHIEFGEGAAQGVAVHAEFFGGLALVALVLSKHFKDVALLELTNGLRVGNAGTVHLCDES